MENQEKYEQITKRLDQLKSALLLDKEGLLYLLKGYTFKEDEEIVTGNWPFKKKAQVSYISQIELSTGYIENYNHQQYTHVVRQIVKLLDDRNRYIIMLKCLNKLGYSIKKK